MSFDGFGGENPIKTIKTIKGHQMLVTANLFLNPDVFEGGLGVLEQDVEGLGEGVGMPFLFLAKHDVDDDVDVAHIDLVVIVDIGIT